MPFNIHNNMHGSENHAVWAWQYVDDTERLAASGFSVNDLGKIGWVGDTDTFFILVGHSPALWKEFQSGSEPRRNRVDIVNNEAEQLALPSPLEGDIAVRSDVNESYAHNGGTAGNMADWTLLSSSGTGDFDGGTF